MHRRPLTAALMSISLILPAFASAQAPLPSGGGVLLNAKDVTRLQADPARFADVRRSCDKKVNGVSSPVAVFAPGAHYSAGGTTAPDKAAKALAGDAQDAYRLGLCYLLTGQLPYAQASQRILDAWGGTLKRVTTLQGRGDITFSVPYMVIAASWVRGAGNWQSATFDRFLKTVVLPVTEEQSKNPNNHGLWATFLKAASGAYLNDAAVLRQARARWGALMAGEVQPDGSLPREMQRSDTNNWRSGPTKGIKGLAYTHYALLPASLAAQVFAVAGQPVWNSKGGALLGKAFARAAAWTLHPETFPYYASNGGKLVGVRDAAYFPLLLQTYANADAQAVLRQGKVGVNGFLLLELFGAKR